MTAEQEYTSRAIGQLLEVYDSVVVLGLPVDKSKGAVVVKVGDHAEQLLILELESDKPRRA